jgi:hypothetical protein
MAMLEVKPAMSPALSVNSSMIPKLSAAMGPGSPGIWGEVPKDSPAKVPVKKLEADPEAPSSREATTVPSKGSVLLASTKAD